MASFGEELTGLIMKHYSSALKGDPQALGRVTAEMATVFGGLLAFSLRFNGRDHTVTVIRTIVTKMLEQGGIIGAKAENILREGYDARNK